ncbi:hypothetical protein [Chamaesiphon minutus]|uniref:Uncharacterized protein n=1 Tax=Chamaesiphon minutus (strain ATCC 27169 / PCC 6605) TaxID=1173020 RepID=K9ULH8_CHAP6|nr:hypothetical protein [Chamaesiphon minutus]AFY95957.1 hypothetical protein Cha6605_5054 [Chamaesiphon minutus PCC 6605]
MTDWEFLIQREGDRGWRPIKTGNLQLTEGKYRIVVTSNQLDTQIQTRVTYQTLDVPTPQRRARSCTQTTNPRGFLVIIPFTYLHSGIWQFVCSSDTQTPSHRILKLRVLAKTQPQPPIAVNRSDRGEPTVRLDRQLPDNKPTPAHTFKSEPRVRQFTEINELPTPTEPLVPISLPNEREIWADGLDRLLEQLEIDSLQAQPKQATHNEILPGTIQINPIVDPPSQLVSLDRSTFSGIIPGDRLIISGGCNLQLLKASQVATVKVEKISICLRHPQTSEIVVSIEQLIPSNLDIFTFRGRLVMPLEPKVTLLLGEVNLYDKHHIQLGSSGFSMTLNLNPLHDAELSLLRMFDREKDPIATLAASGERLHQQLTQELQLEAATISPQGSISDWYYNSAAGLNSSGASTDAVNSQPYPAIPLAYSRQPTRSQLDLAQGESSQPQDPPSPRTIAARTQNYQAEELDLDLADCFAVAQPQRPHIDRQHHNLEIVIDD